jgi:MFS family permease
MESETTYEAAGQPIARPRIRDLFTQRDFILLWVGQAISLFGDQFYLVALPWLVLRTTGQSGAALGVALMLAGIPRAVFILFGGALSDRLSPRLMMILSNVLRGALVAALAALVYLDVLRLWHIYILAFLFGFSDAFFHPAYSSMPPRLLPGRLLEPGNALLQITLRVSVLAGPGLAGVLIARHGTVPALLFDAATFGASVLTLALMRSDGRSAAQQPQPHTPAPAARDSIFTTIRQGLAYVLKDSAVLLVLLMIAIIDFSVVGPVAVGLPVIAEVRFGDPAAYGLMLSGFGAGALVGILLGGVLAIRRIGLLFIGLMVMFGLSFGVMGPLESLPAIIGLVALAGVGSGIFNIKGVSWLQRRTDPALIGRVMSLVIFSSVVLQPVSNALAGLLVDISIPLLFAAAGFIILAGALALLSRREMRGLAEAA